MSELNQSDQRLLNSMKMQLDALQQQFRGASAYGSRGLINGTSKRFLQPGHGFVKGDPIYHDGTDWQKSMAEDVDDEHTPIAVVARADDDGFTAQYSGMLRTIDDLTPATDYWLKVGGGYTDTEPVSPNVKIKVFRSLTEKDALITLGAPAAAVQLKNLLIIGGNSLSTGHDCIKYSADPFTPSALYDPDVDVVYQDGIGNAWYYIDGTRQANRVLVRHSFEGYTQPFLAGRWLRVVGTEIITYAMTDMTVYRVAMP